MYGYIDSDFYNEPSEFEQEIDSFKESLRKAVKEEITDEITKLRATVKEQAGKLANLTELEKAAERARLDYEHKATRAERDAYTKVQKEGLRKLMEVLAKPMYRVGVAYKEQPKCDKCDADRRIAYTTPLGRKQWERCECSHSEVFYRAEEQYGHSISKRSGKLTIWYENTRPHWDESDRDSIGSPAVLKNPEGVPFEELVKNYRDYGFTSKEHAMHVASALNKEQAAQPKEGAKSDGTW